MSDAIKRELKIGIFKNLYEYISQSKKDYISHNDWQILKNNEERIVKIENQSNYELKKLGKEFHNFLDKHFSFDISKLHTMCWRFSDKIDLVRKDSKSDYSNHHPVTGLLISLMESQLLEAKEIIELKRIIKNHYESLKIIRKCLDDYGLLFDEIKKRIEYQRFNFIVSAKTAKGKSNKYHCNIDKLLLEKYVNWFNSHGEKNILIDGKSVAPNIENDVFISATNLTQDEIVLYKKKRSLTDLGFAKCSICINITTDMIDVELPKLANTFVLKEKSFDDCIKKNDIIKAIKILETMTTQDDDNELLMLEGRFNRLERNRRKGTVVNADYEVEINRITAALVEFKKQVNES
jgi:hypothetical protein